MKTVTLGIELLEVKKRVPAEFDPGFSDRFFDWLFMFVALLLLVATALGVVAWVVTLARFVQ